jgi:thiamine kinase-like enzyme
MFEKWHWRRMGPDEETTGRVENILGFAPERWIAAHGGYSSAARFLVEGAGRTAFVKLGSNPLAARLLRHEISVYQTLSGPFMPKVLGFDDGETTPVLVLEDLRSAVWPPPWTTETTTLVLDQIGRLHQTVAALERRTLLYGGRESGWPTVAKDREAFLRLGLVTPAWLEAALPTLIAAEQSCPLDGDAVTHLDLRSDNICIHQGTVKFIDWAEAGIGSPDVDLGFFLPSLAFEGGPLPDSIMPDRPDIAAVVSGFFAARAGLPIIANAPLVRRVQQEQLSTALPWVQRQLGLPQLDGWGR